MQNTLLHRYKNGNVNVEIYSDGTKIREWPDGEQPVPEYPESCDLKITQYCDMDAICVYCFPAGTLIQTTEGEIPIEEVEIGEAVWSFGEGGQELEAVYDKFENNFVGDLIEIETDTGTVLRMTPNHKVLTLRGFVRADELLVTDQVMQFDK
jgi:hypothetical protein